MRYAMVWKILTNDNSKTPLVAERVGVSSSSDSFFSGKMDRLVARKQHTKSNTRNVNMVFTMTLLTMGLFTLMPFGSAQPLRLGVRSIASSSYFCLWQNRVIVIGPSSALARAAVIAFSSYSFFERCEHNTPSPFGRSYG